MGERMATNNQVTTDEEDTMAKRKPKARVPFGGYTISFKGRAETLEALFGADAIPPSSMTKKLWDFVKKNRLATKG